MVPITDFNLAIVKHSIIVAFSEKKVELKRLHPGAILENGATLEGGAVFFP